ncbi:hypothetical protein Arub01_07410 [Actinomadura rubrobrunea]|uniref:Protein kinase domain-containing protein n=1 Tax=Actinomadura rubrobrunea TaxID=115335 RepID=A0A9W6PS71_9ACTN|nr:protein kinase [Actinomadura rubrobrunea]GLW62497.1 hypothetical protein Arub01_07410 [Actinomadura rubrobrunea]
MSGETRQLRQIGPYRLLARLGGPTGTVYRAADPGGRDVAIRVLADGAAALPPERLHRDIERMRRVQSPYAVDVLDGDAAADPPYVVSRFVPGRALADVVAEQGPLRGAALHRLALGMAKALAAVHETGLTHGALGPDTVLVIDGAPVIIDYGLNPHDEGAARDLRAWARTVVFAATGDRGVADADAIPDVADVPDGLRPVLTAALSARPPSAAEAADAVAAVDAGPSAPPPPIPVPAAAGQGPVISAPAAATVFGSGHAASVVRGWARLLSAMIVVVAVGLAITLPLAGTLLSAAAVTALRWSAAPGVRRRLLALVRTAATLPYAAVFALGVGGGMVALSALRVEIDPLEVCAFAAGAGVCALWTAPGVTAPYRQLERRCAAVARSPRRLALAGVALGMLAFLAVVGAISLTPSFAPMYGLQTSLENTVGRLQAALH